MPFIKIAEVVEKKTFDYVVIGGGVRVVFFMTPFQSLIGREIDSRINGGSASDRRSFSQCTRSGGWPGES